jgi:hypothetical protein
MKPVAQHLFLRADKQGTFDPHINHIRTMKKSNTAPFVAWTLLVSMLLWFGSCKKSDDAVTPSAASVQGDWKIVSYKIDPGVDFLGTGTKSNDLLTLYKAFPGGDDIIACLTTTIITFNSNGKIIGKSGPKCTASGDKGPIEDNSTWKLDGNKLTITTGTDVSIYDTTLSGNTLKLVTQEMEDFDGDGKKENYMITIELTKA